MGASESKLVFKQGIFRLSEEKEIPADDPYWTRVCVESSPLLVVLCFAVMEADGFHAVLGAPGIDRGYFQFIYASRHTKNARSCSQEL